MSSVIELWNTTFLPKNKGWRQLEVVQKTAYLPNLNNVKQTE